MGVAGSRSSPSRPQPGFLGEFGFIKQSEGFVRYAEVRGGNYAAFDNSSNAQATGQKCLLGDPFRVSPLGAVISAEDQAMIKTRLKALADQQDALYNERQRKIVANPYAPFSAWYSVAIYGGWNATCVALTLNAGFGCGCLFCVATGPFMLLTLFVKLICGLLDILTCRLSCCRYGAKERAWIDKFMADHPQYDQDAMDSQIAQVMQQLAEELNGRYQGRVSFVYERQSNNYVSTDSEGVTHSVSHAIYTIKVSDPRFASSTAAQSPPGMSAPMVVGYGPNGQPVYGQPSAGVGYGHQNAPGYAPVPMGLAAGSYMAAPPGTYTAAPPGSYTAAPHGSYTAAPGSYTVAAGYPPASYGPPPAASIAPQPQYPMAVMTVSGGAAGRDVEMGTRPQYASL